MNREEVLVEFVREGLLHGSGEEVTAEADLLTSGLIDSLGLMRLIAFIRERFGTEVPYEDILIENFRSVRCIDEYLGTRAARLAG